MPVMPALRIQRQTGVCFKCVGDYKKPKSQMDELNKKQVGCQAAKHKAQSQTQKLQPAVNAEMAADRKLCHMHSLNQNPSQMKVNRVPWVCPPSTHT